MAGCLHDRIAVDRQSHRFLPDSKHYWDAICRDCGQQMGYETSNEEPKDRPATDAEPYTKDEPGDCWTVHRKEQA